MDSQAVSAGLYNILWFVVGFIFGGIVMQVRVIVKQLKTSHTETVHARETNSGLFAGTTRPTERLSSHFYDSIATGYRPRSPPALPPPRRKILSHVLSHQDQMDTMNADSFIYDKVRAFDDENQGGAFEMDSLDNALPDGAFGTSDPQSPLLKDNVRSIDETFVFHDYYIYDQMSGNQGGALEMDSLDKIFPDGAFATSDPHSTIHNVSIDETFENDPPIDLPIHSVNCKIKRYTWDSDDSSR